MLRLPTIGRIIKAAPDYSESGTMNHADTSPHLKYYTIYSAVVGRHNTAPCQLG